MSEISPDIGTIRYTRDAAGNVNSVQDAKGQISSMTTTELYQTSLSWSAGYGNRDRLTSFVRDGAETRYTYDANSNRLSAIDKVTSDTDLDGIFEATDFASTTSQALNVDVASNRLLSFVQTVTTTNNNKTKSVVTTPVNYSVDANGAMTSDGLRTFEYDASNRMSAVKIFKNGKAAKISYLHNAMGQRVFKGEPQAAQTLPSETVLGTDFITWLKKSFGWLYATAQANTSIGTAFVYGDAEIPNWALLGDYDNGSAKGAGRTEYIWLPTEDGGAIPIGLYRGGKFFAIHTDHLGTPRLMTNEANTPVWQWPYSAFGNNKPTGVLKATPNPKAAITNKPVLLKATNPTEMNLAFPGQTRDPETGLSDNLMRMYDAGHGRYTQPDPIGLAGGMNLFAYVGGNPLSYSDPEGLFVPALALPFLGGGSLSLGGWGSAAVAAGSMLAAASISGDTPSSEKRTVPYPDRKRGKYTCICRANKDGRSPDNCSNDNKDFAMGYGEGPTLPDAKRAAEKDAKEKLGAKSTHHIQCRCTGPSGDRIIPHG